MIAHSYVKRRRPHTAGTSYTPTHLADLYGFPQGTSGKGKKIAVIELGGAYSQTDLDRYFHSLGLMVAPVVFHSIGGAKNTSDGPNGADGEVMLDLCVAGGMAPSAELHCYTAPNTDDGFYDAINQAVLDQMDAISISWGGPEDSWDPATIVKFNGLFSHAAALGITITAAAGDNGSGDGEPGQHVDFPSSSPWVLACGGTSIKSPSPLTEVVWNDGTRGGATGGGVSAVFARPAYQQSANIPGGKMRGVPDVAAVADPSTGVLIMIDGSEYVLGGTSAVAPMYAALAVRLSEALRKPVGHLNPLIYAQTGALRDIVTGDNGTYTARVGWDACTGIGVAIGSKLLGAAGPPAAPAPPPAPPPVVPPPSAARTIVVTGASKIEVDGKAV